jgi:uncharacterized membrane protein
MSNKIKELNELKELFDELDDIAAEEAISDVRKLEHFDIEKMVKKEYEIISGWKERM